MPRQSKVTKKNARFNMVKTGFFVLMNLGILAGVFWWFSNKAQGVNAHNLCPLDGAKGQYAILIDRTEAFKEAQKISLKNAVNELVKKLPEGHLLSVYILGDDFKKETQALFSLCNPGDGKGKSIWIENPQLLAQAYHDKFYTPLQNLLSQQLNFESAKESPILEMLQLVNLNSLHDPNVKGEQKLYVISDLMQNSKSLDLYKNKPDFLSFESSYLFKKLWVDFSSIDVQVYLLNNHPKNLNSNFVNFWKAYFESTKAESFQVLALPG